MLAIADSGAGDKNKWQLGQVPPPNREMQERWADFPQFR